MLLIFLYLFKSQNKTSASHSAVEKFASFPLIYPNSQVKNVTHMCKVFVLNEL